MQQKVEFKYGPYSERLEKKVDSNGDGSFDTTLRFAYDAWKVGATRSFVGNENWDVWADLDGSNNLDTRYLRGDAIDEVFSRTISGGTPYWYLTDRLGSIREILDNSAVVKDALTYDGFGGISAETDSAFRGRYAWTGREIDAEINLQFNHARFYDWKLARWTSRDPLGFDAGDSNLYRYVRNTAQTHSDPSGLDYIADYDHHIYWVVQDKGVLIDTVRWQIKVGTRVGKTLNISAFFGGGQVPMADLEKVAASQWMGSLVDSDFGMKFFLTDAIQGARSLHLLAEIKKEKEKGFEARERELMKQYEDGKLPMLLPSFPPDMPLVDRRLAERAYVEQAIKNMVRGTSGITLPTPGPWHKALGPGGWGYDLVPATTVAVKGARTFIRPTPSGS